LNCPPEEAAQQEHSKGRKEYFPDALFQHPRLFSSTIGGNLAGRLAFASEWLTIAADMPFFNNTPDDWQRLDWQILRDGGIHLYWRREYLIEDTKWFANHDYDVFELACETWESQFRCPR
jgi:hypothetical protein